MHRIMKPLYGPRSTALLVALSLACATTSCGPTDPVDPIDAAMTATQTEALTTLAQLAIFGLAPGLADTLPAPQISTIPSFGQALPYTAPKATSVSELLSFATRSIQNKKDLLSAHHALIAAAGALDPVQAPLGLSAVHLALVSVASDASLLHCLAEQANLPSFAQSAEQGVARCTHAAKMELLSTATGLLTKLDDQVAVECPQAASNLDSVFTFMLQFQKLLNNEARADRRQALQDAKDQLNAKAEKLNLELEKIKAMKDEAAEHYEHAMAAATDSLILGILAGSGSLAGVLLTTDPGYNSQGTTDGGKTWQSISAANTLAAATYIEGSAKGIDPAHYIPTISTSNGDAGPAHLAAWDQAATDRAECVGISVAMLSELSPFVTKLSAEAHRSDALNEIKAAATAIDVEIAQDTKTANENESHAKDARDYSQRARDLFRKLLLSLVESQGSL